MDQLSKENYQNYSNFNLPLQQQEQFTTFQKEKPIDRNYFQVAENQQDENLRIQVRMLEEKVFELEKTKGEQEFQIETLRRELGAVRADRDSLKTTLDRLKGSGPSVYALDGNGAGGFGAEGGVEQIVHGMSDQGREEFWTLLDSCRDTIALRMKEIGKKGFGTIGQSLKLNDQSQPLTQADQSALMNLQIKLSNLQIQYDLQKIDYNIAVEELSELQKMKVDYQNAQLLYEETKAEMQGVRHRYEELKIKYDGLEQIIDQLKIDRDFNHQKVFGLAQEMQKRTVEQVEEKKQIQKYIGEIELAKSKQQALKKPFNIRKVKIEGVIGEEVAVDRLRDYILRMRTTAVGSPKYTQTISILIKLLTDELHNAESQENYSYSNKSNSIKSQLKEEINFKALLKGLTSKNNQAIQLVVELINTIGSFDGRIDYMIQTNAFINVLQTYNSVSDIETKHLCLQFSNDFLDEDQATATQIAQVLQQMETSGVGKIHVSDFVNVPISSLENKNYIVLLLEQMATMASHDFCLKEYTSVECLNSVVRYLSHPDDEIKVAVLFFVAQITQQADYRRIVNSKDIMQSVLNLMRTVVFNKTNMNIAIVVAILSALTYFAADVSNRLVLLSFNDQHAYLSTLVSMFEIKKADLSEMFNDRRHVNTIKGLLQIQLFLFAKSIFEDGTLRREMIKAGTLDSLASIFRNHHHSADLGTTISALQILVLFVKTYGTHKNQENTEVYGRIIPSLFELLMILQFQEGRASEEILIALQVMSRMKDMRQYFVPIKVSHNLISLLLAYNPLTGGGTEHLVTQILHLLSFFVSDKQVRNEIVASQILIQESIVKSLVNDYSNQWFELIFNFSSYDELTKVFAQSLELLHSLKLRIRNISEENTNIMLAIVRNLLLSDQILDWMTDSVTGPSILHLAYEAYANSEGNLRDAENAITVVRKLCSNDFGICMLMASDSAKKLIAQTLQESETYSAQSPQTLVHLLDTVLLLNTKLGEDPNGRVDMLTEFGVFAGVRKLREVRLSDIQVKTRAQLLFKLFQ